MDGYPICPISDRLFVIGNYDLNFTFRDRPVGKVRKDNCCEFDQLKGRQMAEICANQNHARISPALPRMRC